ncbi:MAG TPA: helix-turn-helix domain-containing protein [Candidatus Paceibacterota bacterium]|nr:helix-turn-helix domain-containing protein [Candidatus Paceibacterota bacterium]
MTQQTALDLLKTGANIFLTGEPGSGKSYTVNTFVEYLRAHGIEPAITASTGIAATHIGGMTIHSWSGIGIKKVLSEEDLDQLSQNARLTKRLSKTHILIIDEISMLDAQTLTAVDNACRTLRRRDEPFGGLQIVFVGDFFQLPPVSRRGEGVSEFAYLSPAWKMANPLVCYLSEQHRQEDEIFLQFLATLRRGELDDDVHNVLTSRKAEKSDLGHLTRLYTHNIDVDRVNNEKLALIDGAPRTFDMQSRGRDTLITTLKKGCLSPERLALKIGAQVMFTKNNFENGFVNGTLGEVVQFTAHGAPIVKTRTGFRIEVEPMEWTIADGSQTLATIIQYPLRLAWAITVHKSQGMTLDSAAMDLSEAFEYGQGYVALSRVKTLSGLHLLGYNARALEVHPEIIKKDREFKSASAVAEQAIEMVSVDERKRIEEKFITACGGQIEKMKAGERKVRAKSAKKETTYEITLKHLKDGLTIGEIADMRGVTRGTIISHIGELYMKGLVEKDTVRKMIPSAVADKLPDILKAFKDTEGAKLIPVHEKLKGKYSFDDLKLVRILL